MALSASSHRPRREVHSTPNQEGASELSNINDQGGPDMDELPSMIPEGVTTSTITMKRKRRAKAPRVSVSDMQSKASVSDALFASREGELGIKLIPDESLLRQRSHHAE